MTEAVPGLEWRRTARDDLRAIIDHIASDSPASALALRGGNRGEGRPLAGDAEAYRQGRVAGTREVVVRPNDHLIYSETPEVVTILRVPHAAQMWPPVRAGA